MSEAIRVEPNVVYGQAGRDLLCDLYHPEPATANGAATILFHGGGWRGGSRTNLADIATAFARRGFLTVAAEYRLTGEAPWPAQIADVKTVIRWLRASAAEYGLNEPTITLTGFSAGAHLALIAAGTAGTDTFPVGESHPGVSDHVDAVAAFFPPARLQPGTRGLVSTPEEAEAASPITYAAATFPPTILLHGTGDTLVRHSESVNMFEALANAGAVTDLRLYAGVPHEFQRLPTVFETCISDIAGFFERHAVNSDAYDTALTEMRRVWAERAAAMRAAR